MSDSFQNPADVQRIEGFDVPAFWLPHDGPAAAGIVVRSGRGAEPLAMAGVTHLISHLIANELGLPPHGPGAYADLDTVGYSFSGEPEHVRAYLSAYASLLSVPPTEELQLGIDQCYSENVQKEPGVTETLLRMRHGTTGPGSLSFEEYALRKAGQKQIQNWASRYLHNSNAAIWFSGPLLDGMRLRLLNGVPVRINAPILPIPTPGAAYCNKGEVGFSMMVDRSHAFGACVQFAEERARAELVNRRGACTYVNFDIRRHGRSHLELLVTADALNNRDDEVLTTLLWIFEHLASTPPTYDELDEYRNVVAGLFFQPDLYALRARDAAIHFLTETPQDTWQLTFDELDALTPEAISAVAGQALHTTLAVANRECQDLFERFTYVGNWVPTLAQGAQFKPIPLPGEKSIKRELVVGKAGLTLRDGDYIGSVIFAECALMLRADDGYRELISESGSRVVIVANAWEKSKFLLDLIDTQCLPERTIVMDEQLDRRGGYVGAERRRWAR